MLSQIGSLLALTIGTSMMAAARPAGGPQGPIAYAPGTILKACALQPSGEQYLSYNYTGPKSSLPYIKKSTSDAATELEFVTINKTSTSGYTGLALKNASQGLDFVAGVLQVASNASMDGFAAWAGTLVNHANAPHGFYYCENTEGSGGSVGAEDASSSHNLGSGKPCSDFALVLIQPSY